jgi:serpin B
MNKHGFAATIGIALALGCASGTKQNAKPLVDEPEAEQPSTVASDTGQESETQDKPAVEPEKNPGRPPSPAKEPEAKKGEDFVFGLYRQLTKKEGNLFFSPYSLQVALAMTYGGARGETEKQMADALHFPKSQDELHQKMFEAQSGLDNIEGVELSVANSLWPAEKYPFKKVYLKLIEEKYSARATPLDFAKNPEKARQTINKWVSEKTKKKIEKLIDKGFIDALTTMILTNAIYFKGAWSHPFDVNDTKDVEFTVSARETVRAPMMGRTNEFNFFENERLQILELPYVGGEISMFAILPRSPDDLAAIESELSEAKVTKWLESMHRNRVQLLFPKFKFQSSFEIKQELSALGMIDAFDGLKANFTGMAEPENAAGLFISAVIHKAVVDVNEEGTEAAAATAVVMKRSMPPRFIADHPFLFFIRDKKTGSILFVGRMANPVAS